jgi:site-specific DNA-cytosine methylase
MKVLSLFDGMSCGMIAIVVGNHNVERYVAFENETKYATKTASHNFPDIEQRGDVFEADFTEFEGFDVVLAGFPCTKFSVAQKKKGKQSRIPAKVGYCLNKRGEPSAKLSQNTFCLKTTSLWRKPFKAKYPK